MAIVSVVTPVHNGEPYLRSCIESVLAQNFSDWEYIIVDNCSTDRSWSIAESYAAEDKRIRIYSNEQFLPVIDSFNRTVTLVSPEAKYLKFVCADDLIFPDCLKLMVALAEAEPTVRLVGAYKIRGKYPVCESPPYPKRIVSGKEVCKWFFQGRVDILGSETNHLIKLPADWREKTLFDRMFETHSDTELFVRLLKDGGDFGFVHQILTFSRVHDASVSSRESHVLGTGPLEWLGILMKHGHDFLSKEDFERLVRTHRRLYNRFLFRSLLKVWDRRIWEYHAARWKRLGIRIRSSEMVRCALWEAGVSAIRPLDSIRRTKGEYLRVKRAHESSGQ